MLSLLTFFAAGLGADDHSFSAADAPKARLRANGKVVVKNTGRTITAWHFFGDVQQALFTLKTISTLGYRPYGQVLYDARANAANVPAQFSPMVAEAALTHGVDPRLVAAIARHESSWNPRCVSRAGATGIMQLMPETAQYLGVNDLYDARQNILGGTRYLRTLLDAFHGDLDLTLAAYNAGPGAVERYNGVPPFQETRNYVANVRATYERALRN